jgi:hypothetical protein
MTSHATRNPLEVPTIRLPLATRWLALTTFATATLAGSVVLADDGVEHEFTAAADYQIRSVRIDPLDLSGDTIRETIWTEQRLRLDLGWELSRVAAVHVQLDALDGVLFGDNGRYGGDPEPNSGVNLAAKRPNVTRWDVGLLPDGDPLDPDGYGPVLVKADPIEVNYAYGEVYLPLGLLRFGRQPITEGGFITSHDGGRRNRWGASEFNDTADRLLFATKLSEYYRFVAEGDDYTPDVRRDDGVFFASWYDWYNQGLVYQTSDDLRQIGNGIQLKKSEANWFGLPWKGLEFHTYLVHLRDEQFDSRIYSVPLRLKGSVGDHVDIHAQTIVVVGETREISEGFSLLGGSKEGAAPQKIRSGGGQFIADVTLGDFVLTFEVDYATGDANPGSDTPITKFGFARDFNVGLLLFERILRFESARSVGVGIENLATQDAGSFPLTEVASDGRFTNALALFPQLTWNAFDNAKHHLHLRGGVLIAWPDTGGNVDPILTALGGDGNRIDDDAVNFHGGKPGSYYGTELDFQIEWVFKKHFRWTIESAVLIPGSSLEDEHGNATVSWLLENRLAVVF